MSRYLSLMMLTALALCMLGCGVENRSASSGSLEPTETAAPVATAAVKLTPADEKDLAALIERQKGRVVFVDFWATFCKPCVKNFPHTVELHKKYQGEGLVVVSMNFDSPDEKANVQAFLEKQGATFENLISKYDAGNEANEAFDFEGLPHLRLYDRQGKLRYKWEGKANDLEAKVKELLAES